MNTNDDKFQESLKFVATHYEHGAFSSGNAWRKLMCGNRFDWKRKIAAAAVVCVVLAASAFLYTSLKPIDDKPQKVENSKVEKITPDLQNPISTARLEFTDAPLDEVVKCIEDTYGVKISGIPEEKIKLTLSYEGTADDIVETINDTLQINLVVEKEDTKLSTDK